MSESDEEVEYESEQITLGPHRFDITTVSHMPIHILMRNASQGVEISGQKIWCGSLGVCQYLIDHPDIVAGKAVVELGAGTGLLGMLCSRLGAGQVILTDNDPRSLEHMQQDCQTNQITAQVQSLDWFHPELSALQTALDGSRPFLLVAGDVLYKRVLLQPFFATARAILDAAIATTDSPMFLLCHIPRAEVEHEHVREAACAASLLIEEIAPEHWRKGCAVDNAPAEDYMRARLYTIKRS